MNAVNPLCPSHVAFSSITTLLRYELGKAENNIRILPFQCETKTNGQGSKKGRRGGLGTATELLFLHVGVTGYLVEQVL